MGILNSLFRQAASSVGSEIGSEIKANARDAVYESTAGVRQEMQEKIDEKTSDMTQKAMLKTMDAQSGGDLSRAQEAAGISDDEAVALMKSGEGTSMEEHTDKVASNVQLIREKQARGERLTEEEAKQLASETMSESLKGLGSLFGGSD